MDTASAALSPSQRNVLETIKRHGEATAGELAVSLEISSSAVRQHLNALRSAGLIESRQERGNTGRPADRYHATQMTEALFVVPEGDLSTELLRHMEEEDPELVGRIFERRRRRLVEGAMAELEGLSVGERVAAVTDLLDAQGYLADFERVPDGGYRINLHSCAIWTVANRYRQACTAELEFVRDLLPGASVERVTHKTAGAHTCAYQIRVSS